jgi:hypothetical protein
MTAQTETVYRRVTLYVAAGLPHRTVVECSGEGWAIETAQCLRNSEAERLLEHIQTRYADVEIVNKAPQRAEAQDDRAVPVDTWVIVTQSVRSDGLSQSEGNWYSDQVEHTTYAIAREVMTRRQRNERSRSSRGGHVFNGYRWRIWTAAEYDTFISTGRAPFAR